MPDEATHETHRQSHANSKEDEVGEAEERRPCGRRKHREDRRRARQPVQSPKHRRAVLMLVTVLLMCMPMRVGGKIVVRMEMEMAASTGQIDPSRCAKQDHGEADQPFGDDRDLRRKRMPQQEKGQSDGEQNETVTDRPTQPGTNALTGSLFSRGQDGQRHHVIGIKSVDQSQNESQGQPGSR